MSEFGQSGPTDVESHRRLLFSVAYRLVGAAHDAEDMVQETYTRWYQMAPEARATIESPRAWLVRVASRVCLDHLGSARVRRESYVGDWLPEPLPGSLVAASFGSGTSRGDPLHDITLDESVSTALLVLLEEVTPAERVTFILHDVFGLPFQDISDIVGRSPAACRQLAVSARRHVRPDSHRRSVDAQDHSTVVSAFKQACTSGNLQDLINALAPEVVIRVDGGGNTRAALRPVVGSDNVARFMLGVIDRRPTCLLIERTVNGKNGIMMTVDNRTVGVYSFDVVAGRIQSIWAVVNPDKLDAWND